MSYQSNSNYKDRNRVSKFDGTFSKDFPNNYKSRKKDTDSYYYGKILKRNHDNTFPSDYGSSKRTRRDYNREHASSVEREEGCSNRKSHFTFLETRNLLYKILEENFSENITLKLLDPQVRIVNFLNNDQNDDPDIIKAVFKVIIKASENKIVEQNFRKLLVMVLETKFALKRIDKVISIDLISSLDLEMLTLLIRFLKLNFEIVPSIAYDVFYNRVHTLSIVLDSLQFKTKDISLEIIHEFEELKELSKSSSVPTPRKGLSKKSNIFNDVEPPDDFKTISIFPTSKDLINVRTKEVFLRENKSSGAYKSVDHYLDVQFRLMREDFIQPLREGLLAFRNTDSKTFSNIRVYKKVYLMYSLPAGKLGVIHNMLFDKSRFKKINWEQSKQFLYGSLLCFSSDSFNTLLFATIVHRDIEDLKNGVLSVKFHDSSPNEDEEYTLIETTNMFESYKHVLLSLQQTNEQNLGMKKYLVYAETNISMPGYLIANRGLEYIFKEKIIYPGLVDSQWPRAVDLDMDESQFQAFKSALTKELTIIQGPPGTGKTYLGLNVCKCLIKNVQSKIRNFGPILIVCYTNHALDQFLEGISEFTEKIVRVGSRCKSEKIREYSLFKLKRKCVLDEFLDQRSHYFSVLKSLKEKLMNKQAGLTNSKEKFICLKKLKKYISGEHLEYLEKSGLSNWLSGKSVQNERFNIEKSVESMIEWMMHKEIMSIIKPIVIAARKEHLRDLEDSDKDDMDNEVNYINYQRRIDGDEEDIRNLNSEFNHTLSSCQDLEELLYESNCEVMTHSTTKRLFESRLRQREKMSEEEVSQVISIDELSLEKRWDLYRYWRSKYSDSLLKVSDELEKDYDRCSNQINEIYFEEDRKIMEEQNIIGMTTTGAARYSKVLSVIQCKIIIVEEAAEVLESHIVGSLNPGCEHLILIGDHKQLKPNPAVYELAQRYDLDVSLFERLINNHLPYNTLSLQHRMRPEIAEIMGFIYKNLENDESVLKYPNVPSVGNNLHFFDHQHLEERTENIMSYSNPFEAELVVKFCRHLMKNGVEKSQMTILTLYSGQMFLLRRQMDRNIFDGVRVCVVDNYQGEENDIIILSLVRSNEHEKIGFLSIENRICVSLSRAKHGLFVFGNFQVLSNQNKKWKEICQFLKRKDMLSDNLMLFCQNHPEKKVMISKPCHFNQCPEGGCREVCNQRLACGHACRKACHFLDKNHETYTCTERCTKLCENGHRCNLKCWEGCTKCKHKIEKVIPACNHRQLMSCGKVPSFEDCQNQCERLLPCNHQCSKSCNERCGNCLIRVEKISPYCGHKGEYFCYDRDMKCTKTCESLLGCEHKCSGTCGNCSMGRLHQTCQNNCNAQLICGHACQAKCSRHCPPCRRDCEEGCSHNGCPNRCGEDCVSCYEECQWECPHQKCNKLCYELCDRNVCNKFCNKFVYCDICGWKFLCYGVCGEYCRRKCFDCDPEILEIFFGTEDEDNAMFITLWTCEHSFEVNSMDKYMNTVPEDGEIITKKCPRCKTIINKQSCFRYLNIVKQISSDIKSVQKKMIGNHGSLSEYQNRLDANRIKVSAIFQMYDIKNYFHVSEKLRDFEIFPFKTSLELISQLYDRCFSNGRNINSDYIDNCLHNLILWLNPKERKFNEFEIGQFNIEFDRLDMLLKINEGQQEMDVPLKEISDFVEELKAITFVGEQATDFKLRWKTFQKEKLYLPNMDITEYERKEIVKAIGLDKGRWFKCPEGHFYVIGECGGATEISKCPECNSSIGGNDHRLLRDNKFAPEMDHSEAPAWPGMRNDGD